MVARKAGKEKPKKPQPAGAVRVMKGEVPVATLRSNQLNKKLQTSQQSLQRSTNLEAPQVVTKKASAISIKLGSSKPRGTLAPKTLSVAGFNEDEDSEQRKCFQKQR
uniref:Uncharacterized protein n=1 Tax=Panthera leo TaxID=9689 RepID=A0A8C8X6Y7_PANLE